MDLKLGTFPILTGMVLLEVNGTIMVSTKATNEIILHNQWLMNLQLSLMVETIFNGPLHSKILPLLHAR